MAFVVDLAVHFRMLPSELLQRGTAMDYALLAERFLERPFGDERQQLAVLTATMVNNNPFRDKDATPRSPDDYLPTRPKPLEPAKPQQPVDQQIESVKLLVAALNGGRK